MLGKEEKALKNVFLACSLNTGILYSHIIASIKIPGMAEELAGLQRLILRIWLNTISGKREINLLYAHAILLGNVLLQKTSLVAMDCYIKQPLRDSVTWEFTLPES